MLQSGSNQTKRNLINLLAVLVFLISGVPKLNVSFGFPLYAIDVITFYLLFKTRKYPLPAYSGYARLITQLIGFYLFFVVLGEAHGALIYGKIPQHIYIVSRLLIIIPISYLIPKLITELQELKVIIKSLCLGLLLSSVISILYSFPFTRSLTNLVFSVDMLEPAGESVVRRGEAYIANDVYGGADRGRTLIGTSTLSAGVMAAFYPLVFIGADFFRSRIWINIFKTSILVIPLGILATYGRMAWLSLVLIILSTILWGKKKARAKLVGVLMILLIIFSAGLVNTQSVTSSLPLLDRIIVKTQTAVDDPLEGESERERFLAYVEPFEHVFRYPSFLVTGSGSTQRKFGGNKYEEAITASHAIPAMAYYAYGVGGACCQIGLMFASFCLIYRRLHQTKRRRIPMIGIWRALLAAWFGLLPWWMFAHGIVTAPRAAAVFFLFLGIVLTYENIYTNLRSEAFLFENNTIKIQ